ncbi:MAG: hypothetical protein ACXVAY_19890 [Mucilaginibacter sp.]
MIWTVSVIIICVLITVIAIWLEYRRENETRLALRIVVTLIAVAALACIALPITFNGKAETTQNNEVVLLTEGYNPDSLAHYKQFFTMDAAIKKAYPKAILLTGIEDINSFAPGIDQLHIAGYGLDKADLQQFQGINITYYAPLLPGGIQAINWQQQLKAGDQLRVQGKFNNATSKPIKLLLKGLNTALDSVNIPAGQTTSFALTATPKIAGRAAYTLLALNGKDTIEKENIPLAVEPPKPVKVLLLSASPDFETKFLKNWLASNGYVVASKAIISKDKTSQDFVNMAKQPLDNLSTALLDKFDVIIADLSALTNLPTAEASALRQQVEQQGLGIVIRADSTGKASSWLQEKFRINNASVKTPLILPLSLQNQQARTSPLAIDPSFIENGNNLQNLVYDTQNHILASSTLSGQGKLVYTTIHNTYTWMLAGSDKDYTSLWSLLISKAARKSIPTANWQVENSIAMVNKPVTLQIQSGTTPAKLTINGSTVPVLQNPLIPYQYTATYWPENMGWQQINSVGQPPSWWYVYPDGSWKTINELKKITETKNFAKGGAKSSTVTKQIQQSAAIEVPKMYFYLLLLASCTFLWVERKLAA